MTPTQAAQAEHNDGDDSSDYGWDLALEEHLHQLIALETPQTTITAVVTAAHETLRPVATPEEGVSLSGHVAGTTAPDAVREESSIAYPDLTHLLNRFAANSTPSVTVPAAIHPSPLDRFRTAPRKPLSVSDLTAGAWCELQYEYTLTRLPGGRRTRTAAMRAGTQVHARLEEEVHTTVRVEVASREDVQGLRLWNMIQGFRTLRETGLTRELDVWGVVEGQVVSGVVDELSYKSPRDEEEKPEFKTPKTPKTPTKTRKRAGTPGTPATPQSGTRITDYFSSPARPTTPPAQSPSLKVYITDIKTRGSTKLPSGAAMLPTKIQLLLYHRFLADMATDRLDWLVVFQRYSLAPDAPFSDAFIAQIGDLHDEIFNAEGNVDEGSTDEVIRYRTLRSLAGLLRAEVALTFPHGADSLGQLVTAEYRLRPRKRRRRRSKAVEQEDEDDEDSSSSISSGAGRCIGTKVMAVNDTFLDLYLAHYFEWWRGQRAATGVDIEEASLKCGFCEFAADCDWRSKLDEQRVRRVRERLATDPKD